MGPTYELTRKEETSVVEPPTADIDEISALAAPLAEESVQSEATTAETSLAEKCDAVLVEDENEDSLEEVQGEEEEEWETVCVAVVPQPFLLLEAMDRRDGANVLLLAGLPAAATVGASCARAPRPRRMRKRQEASSPPRPKVTWSPCLRVR